MAKGARASSVKVNNLALKKNVFGPVETARNERLHAKLAALIAQPKPSELKAGETMETAEARITAAPLKSALKVKKSDDDMEVDNTEAPKISTAGSGRSMRKKSDSRRSAIVFPKYKAGKKVGLKVRKARRS